MGSIRLVVTDLDGTFWHGREVIHPATRSAVDELTRRGIDLLLATGRRLQSVRRGMTPAGIDRPAVLLSGALGVDLTSGDEWHRAGFEVLDAIAVLSAFREEGVEPVVYVGSRDLEAIAAIDCATSEAHVESFAGALRRGAPDDVVASGEVVAFGVIGGVGEQALLRVATRLEGLANAWFSPDGTFGGWTLMVSPATITKVTGVAPWCAARGYAPHEVLAVGDGSNDFALLDWAGMAVAVQGTPTAERPHDAVIAGPEDGGWAELLDLI